MEHALIVIHLKDSIQFHKIVFQIVEITRDGLLCKDYVNVYLDLLRLEDNVGYVSLGKNMIHGWNVV